MIEGLVSSLEDFDSIGNRGHCHLNQVEKYTL